MLKADDKDIINAGDELTAQKHKAIDGERGSFKFSNNPTKWPVGTKSLAIATISIILTVLSYFVWRAYRLSQALPGEHLPSVPEIVGSILPPLNLQPKAFNKVSEQQPSLPNSLITAPAVPISLDSSSNNEQNNIAQAIINRRLAAELKDNSSNNKEVIGTTNASGATRPNHNNLQDKLQPLRLEPSVAGLLDNADYLLTQGAMLDCQLETRLITTQPGMTSCYVTRNIFSTNGKMLLLERGSKIVGNYQGGITQGQARIFVVWSRIETPKGIIINLDSPGTGSLGEAGLGGNIDSHFWQRFGGAIMISLIGDFGEYLSSKGQKQNNNTTIQFDNTSQGAQQAAVEALKNSINIPPTLYKNQGERVSIFVARDLDFSKVYAPR